MKHLLFVTAAALACALAPAARAQNAAPLAVAPPVPIAPITATVDPSIQFQRFEGWGTSLAWWAHVVGNYPAAAQRDYLDKAFDPAKGLGLNVVRYNIGGGENPLYLPPNTRFIEFRAAVPGFLRADGTYDWTADAGQRLVLQEAIRRGANRLEAFSNSPPYFMTQSGSVSGNHEGRDNIKPESDAAFAAYLVEVTRHFRDHWGVKFDSLEPLNEPSGGWWKFGGHQEGAHVDRPHQNTIIKATLAALKARGITTPVAASDESVIDDAARTIPFYDAASLAGMSRINTHSYGGSARAQVSALTLSRGKDLWLSEYGDGDASGMPMARRIVEDIRGLHPSAWCYWQVVDSAGGWGFLRNPQNDFTTTAYTVNKKYYVMGQFSRYIRPDARFLAVDDLNTLAALDARSGTLTVVTVNSGDADAPFALDLSGFARVGAAAQVVRTSRALDGAALPALALQNKTLRAINPPHSVTTYIVRGTFFGGKTGFDPQRFYTLVSANDGRVLQIPTEALDDFQPVTLGRSEGRTTQQWRIVGLGGGKYELVNRADGLALEVGGASLQNGAAVDVYHDKAEAPARSNQHWRLLRRRDGSFQLLNTLSGLALQSAGDTAVQATEDGGDDMQGWRIVPVGAR